MKDSILPREIFISAMDNTEPINPTTPPEKKENKFVKKIKSFSSNFKALPMGTKRLLSLGFVVALLVALPIVVMTIVTSRTFFLNRAATGETVEPPLTPTPSPTNNPTPTPTTKPTITPTPLIKPIISTTSLPEARVKKIYSANIVGYENTANAKLTIKISGLPGGLSYTCLTGNSIGGSKTTASCSVKGSPLLAGTFKILVSLSDSFGRSASKTFTLVVSPF